MTAMTKDPYEETMQQFAAFMETHEAMCDAARENRNALPPLHERVVAIVQRQEHLAEVQVRVYHAAFGEYGNTMLVRRLPAPYREFFFHHGAFWRLSAAPPLGGEDLLVVEYAASSEQALLDLICDPELPKHLIFEE